MAKRLEKRARPKRLADFKNKARWAANNVDIKRWKPIYEQMVQLSVMGYSASDIRGYIRSAGGREYSLVTIYKILNSLQALEIKKRLIAKLQANLEKSNLNKMDALADRAIFNIEKVLNNEELLEESPLAIFDRSMTLVRGLGKINKDVEAAKPNVNVNVGVGLSITEKQITQLAASLEESNEVIAKHFLPKRSDG